MALSAFDDRERPPDDDELHAVLGRASGIWNELVEHLVEVYSPVTREWTFSGKKWGWALAMKRKKRAIVYLTPCARHFLAGFALGEKAVQAAHAGGLPASVLECIDNAPRYAEGRGVRFELRTKKDLEAVKQVAAVKMAN